MASWGTALNTTQLNFNYESEVRVTAMDICLTYVASAPLVSTSRVAAANELHSVGARVHPAVITHPNPTDIRPTLALQNTTDSLRAAAFKT
jgi:hypothetical protein